MSISPTLDYFRLTFRWTQGTVKPMSPKCPQPFRAVPLQIPDAAREENLGSKCGVTLQGGIMPRSEHLHGRRRDVHCHSHSALRCFGGNIRSHCRSAASAWFWPSLACSQAALSRGRRGGLCGPGHRLVQCAIACMDARCGLLANRACIECHGGVRLFRDHFVPQGAKAVIIAATAADRGDD
jgi:hypothetical protein